MVRQSTTVPKTSKVVALMDERGDIVPGDMTFRLFALRCCSVGEGMVFELVRVVSFPFTFLAVSFYISSPFLGSFL